MVFEWDSTPQRSGGGPGTGAGIGYYESSSEGALGLVSADAVSWMELHPRTRLAVEPVVGEVSKARASNAVVRTASDRVLNVFPNPANPAVAVVFELASSQDVRLDVYDLRGRLVRRIERPAVPAGTHEMLWLGTDQRGVDVASGVYHLKVQLGSQGIGRSVTVVR